jgi:hypothetical protein
MTRRDWVSTMAAGFGLSLLPACSTLSQETAGPVAAAAPREARPAPQGRPLAPADVQPAPVQVAADPVRVSPYNPIPRSKVENTGSQGEESSYPPVSSNELLPQPRTLDQALDDQRRRQQVTVTQPAPAEPKSSPAPDPPLVWAMRCFLDKRPVEAMEALKRYDKTSQDLLLCMLPLAARLGEGSLQRATPREMSNTVSELNRVADTLAPRAELVIDKMCFCRFLKDSDKFGMFGVYEPLEEDHPFYPGERKRLYIELRNFTNERVSNGYQIRLKSHMQIRDYRGAIAWELGFPELRADITKSPRHDFCDQFGFVVQPNKVPPGRYTLWLRVTDVPTGRTAARSLDFLVVPARNLSE